MNLGRSNRAGVDPDVPLPVLRLERKILKLMVWIILAMGVITFLQNLILETNKIQIILSITCTLFSIFGLFLIARLDHIAPLVYSMLVFFYLFMIVLWFVSEGFAGSTPYLYFLYVTGGVIFVHTRHRVPFIVIMLFTFGAMLVIEYNFPGLVMHYTDNEQRFLDAIITFFASMAGTGVVIYFIFNHYLIALNEIKTLRRIFPVCANCNKIRNEQGEWDRFEAYFTENSEAQFSHSICPQCTDKLYPDFNFNK